MADSLDDIFAPLTTPKTGAAQKPSLDDLFAPITPGGVAPPPSFRSEMPAHDAGVDYETGAPVQQRYNLMKASNPAEQKLVLDRAYGAGNYKQDSTGNWLFKQGDKWTAVYPRGVWETMKTGGAAVASAAPKIGGAAAGAAMGAPAGPLGAIAGAAGGAGLGYSLDEIPKALTGTFSKTPMETLREGGAEMLMAGAFQSAGPAGNAVKNRLYQATSDLARRKFTVDPQSQAVAQGLQRFGRDAAVPIGSLVPRWRPFEFDRAIRKQISGDPLEPGRVRVVDQRMGEILQRFGLQGRQLGDAMDRITTSMARNSPTEASERIMQVLRNEEGTLRAADQRGMRAAQEALDRHAELIRRNTVPLRNLGERVVDEYQSAGREFRRTMDQAYGAASQAAGDAPAVLVEPDLLRTMDPLSLPGQIRALTQIDDATGEVALRPMTHLEAHRLRTWLRDRSNIRAGDQAPIGQTAGDFHRMAGMVDDAMGEAATNDPRMAAGRELLRNADREYSAGVTRFTSDKINNLAWQVRQGRSPDPDEVARIILDKNSAAATRQLWDMLSPETRQAVETADIASMLAAASTVGKNGQRTINPDTLLRAIDERQEYARFVHAQRDAATGAPDPRGRTPFLDELRRVAIDFKTLRGDIDVTALPAGLRGQSSATVRRFMEDALGARRALVERATADPAMALTSDNPELAREGAEFFLKNEARTTGARDRFGAQSPEWQQVQQYALEKLLRSTVVQKTRATSEGVGRTVSSGQLREALSSYTEAQQRALFPQDVIDDVRLLVNEADLMFPHTSAGSGGSMTGANVMGHLLTKQGLKAAAYYRLWGMVSDSQQLRKLLVGQLRQDPYAGRALMGWIAQGGLQSTFDAYKGESGSGAEPSEFSKAMQPKPKPPLPREYGGPMQ